jgi:hydroxymethylpyrimidine/phosphomethylpyrimidine kinase
LSGDARQAIREELLPLATVITPNIFEAEALLACRIGDLDAMRDAAQELWKIGCPWVVVKGGCLDIESQAIDVLYDGKEFVLLKSPRLDSRNTHGTGCTFASAIAAGLAKGLPPPEAARRAKEYITEAIRSGWPIGGGNSPPNHLAGIQSDWA